MIWLVLTVFFYLISGFLVYGMRKAMHQSHCEMFEDVGYTVEDEREVMVLALF